MSAGGAGAGFTVSTGEAALSRLLSSIIIVVCSGAAMLCYRAPAHRSLLWMMLSDDGDAFQISSSGTAPLPRQRGKGEAGLLVLFLWRRASCPPLRLFSDVLLLLPSSRSGARPVAR